jgi:D-alanine-D-alanine ligase
MDITILAYLEPDDDRPDVVMEQVAAALEARGHKTSLLTIRHDVAELLDGLKKRKPQLVFNLVEAFGHDIIGGVMGVAGVLDLLDVPYTGGGPGELFLQEDKALAKKLRAFEHIPYPDFATFAPNADFETGGNLRMPLFVKPLRMDASIGIDERSLVHNTQQLMERVLHIQKTWGDAALAEEYIEGREFYVGVLGNQQPAAFPPIEIDFSGLKTGALHVMDALAKFDETSDRFQGTKAIIADLEPEVRARLQKVSVEAYRALRVRDYGRIDLRLTDTGEIYVIEVNANCYLEQASEYASAAAAHGVEYPDLLNRIAELAVERHRQRRMAHRRRKKSREAPKAAAKAEASALAKAAAAAQPKDPAPAATSDTNA